MSKETYVHQRRHIQETYRLLSRPTQESNFFTCVVPEVCQICQKRMTERGQECIYTQTHTHTPTQIWNGPGKEGLRGQRLEFVVFSPFECLLYSQPVGSPPVYFGKDAYDYGCIQERQQQIKRSAAATAYSILIKLFTLARFLFSISGKSPGSCGVCSGETTATNARSQLKDVSGNAQSYTIFMILCFRCVNFVIHV